MAHAQVLYGELRGSVSDSTEAVVPGAGVTITHQQTGQVRRTSTGPAGSYSFINLQPGEYRAEVSAGGFQTFVQTEVQVTINTVTRLDVVLRVGQVSEALTVSGTGSILQADKSDVHVELAAKELTELPLPAYRNFQSLVNLVPGATPGALQNSVNDTPQRDLSANVNGANRNANNVHLDGSLNKMNIISSHIMYVPPAESIETVNITTNAFDAEQGMTGGAAITVITKSGTNTFHGSAFAFHTNNALQSRNFFFQGSRTPKNIGNIDGFTLGGPIRRNKLFFFVDWEGLRERLNYSQLYSVPNADQRAGNFAAYNTAIYDPLTGDSSGRGRAAFPGSVIPANRQSSISQKLQALVPLPNLPGNANNYFGSGTAPLNRDNYDAKVNWNRTDKHSIWGKYGRMDASFSCYSSLGAAGGPGLCNPSNPKPGDADTLIQIASLGTTWILSPSLLFDGTIGYSRMAQDIRGPFYGTNFGLDTLGIPGANGPDPRQSGQPGFAVTGYTAFGDNNAANPAFRKDAVWTHTSNLSLTKGAHELRFGFEVVDFQQNDWQPNITGGPRGSFAFTGGVTALNGGAAPNQYNAYAQFLLGLPGTMSKALQYYSPQTAREWQFGWYARDRWQVSRSLTLSLGLRYEYYPQFYRTNQGAERYDPGTNNVIIGGRGGNPDNAGIFSSKRLFAPRVGLAYRLGTNTVIRSGYGISIDPSTISGAIQRPYPVVVGQQFTGANTYVPYASLAEGIPLFTGPDVSSGVTPLPATAQTQTQPGGLFPRGYIQSWNAIVERRLPSDLVASVGYVGTHTVRQMVFYDINAGVPGLGLAGQPLYARWGRSATTSVLNPGFSAEYNALQATLNRRFSRGLLLKISYTFSHAIDFTDDNAGGLSFNTPSQVNRNRALAGFDLTHIFQSAWVYDLPFGPGKTWLKNKGIASALARDWQINGVLSRYSGLPFTVTASGTSLNAPGNTQTADLLKPTVEKYGKIGPGVSWFDTTAFASVTAARYGTAGRNIMRGPGTFNLDLSLFRSVSLTERISLQIRGEAFNATNTPHFDNPAANVSTTSSFGTITSAGQGGRVIRLALRLTF